MTIRAILIGVFGAIAIATLGYINDQILLFNSLIAGHQLPIAVVGTLIVWAAAVNPLLCRLVPRLGFRPAELATTTMLLLVSCSVPCRGLLEHILPALAMPVHYYELNPGWQKNDLLSYAPAAMMLHPDTSGDVVQRNAVNWLVTGAADVRHTVGVGRLPWAAWREPLTFWMPMVALVAAASISLALIVHRQWSAHERLRYPIADFTTALLDRPEGSSIGQVFKTKLFWIALGIVVAIHIVNGLNKWYNGSLIEIPLDFSLKPIRDRWPSIKGFPWADNLLRLRIYPVVLGFSFFLATEVSLSLGLSQWLWFIPCMVLISRGEDVSSDFARGGLGAWLRFGAYLAMAVMMLYIGRRYYWSVLKSGLTFRQAEGVEPHIAWACRVLIVAVAGMVGMAVSQGLPWPFAIMTFGMILLMYICVARITAETGLFFVQPRWLPLGVMIGLFGGYSLGPQAMVIISLLCMILSLDVSQSLLPYFVNSLRICQNVGLKPLRTVAPAGSVYAIAVAIGLVAAFWASYNFGIKTKWTKERVPTDCFNAVNAEITQTRIAGQLEESKSLSTLQRLAALRPDKKFLASAGVGVALALVVGFLRLRLPWWPLHPVVFLVWDTYPMSHFSHSFLIGWLAKVLVTRLGGFRTYQKAKPIMIGLIAGDLLGVLVWMVVDGIYYLSTGLTPTDNQIYYFFPK